MQNLSNPRRTLYAHVHMQTPADDCRSAKMTDILAIASLYFTFIVGDNELSAFGAFLPDIEVRVLGVCTTLAFLLASGARRTPAGTATWAIVSMVWIGYLLLSTWWAPLQVSGYRSAREELIWLGILIVLALVVFSVTPRSADVALWWAAYLSGTVFAIAGLVAGAGSQGRFSAFGGGPNTFVRIVFVGLLAAVVLALHLRKTRFLLLAPVLVIAIVLSGSRGGLLAAFVSALVFVFLVRRKVRFSSLVLASVGIVIAVSVLALNTSLGSEARGLFAQRFVTEAVGEGNFSGRTGLYAEAIVLFKSNPFVGVGAGGFAQLQTVLALDSHAHNIVLSTLSEGGVVGTILLILLLVTCFRVLELDKNADPIALGASVGALFILFVSQSSGYYFDFRMFFLFVALVASRVSGAAEGLRRDEE